MESRNRSGRVAFWLILGLAALLRFYQLGAEGFWLDEVLSLGQAPVSVWNAVVDFWLLRGLGRRISLLPLGLALHLGDSEFVARLPYAIFSVLEVAALYLVVRRLRDARTARLAMLLLALSPLHVWYAQEVRWYAQWSLCTTLTYLALVYAWKDDLRTAWWAYAAATVANFATFVLSVLVAAIQGLVGLLLGVLGAGRRFVVRQYVSLLAGCLVAAPAFAVALRFHNTGTEMVPGPVGTVRTLTLFELPYTAYTFLVGFSLGPTVGELHQNLSVRWVIATYPEILLIAAIALPILVAALRAALHEPSLAAVVLPWAFLLPAFVFAIAVVADQTYNVRYAFPALTGFVTLLAIGVLAPRRRWMRIGAGTALVLLFSGSLASYYWNPKYDKEHVREAVAIITESGSTEAVVAFVGQGVEVVRHYGPALEVHEPRCSGAQETAKESDRTAGGSGLEAEPVVWLVVSRDWAGDAAGCIEALGRTHRETLHRELPGVEMWRFEQPRTAAPPGAAQPEQSAPEPRNVPSASTRT